MKHLLTTTALALVVGATAFAAPGQAQKREPGYCGQSWVQVDANDDGKVTQSEAEAATAVEFSAVDANADGRISADEYRDCRTGGMTTAGKANGGSSGQQAGANSTSGSTSNSTSGSAATSDSQGKREAMEAAGRQAWESADRNKDGRISAQEYAAASRQAYDRARQAQADGPEVIMLRRYVLLVPQQTGTGDTQSDKTRDMNRDEAAARSAMKFSALDQDGDGNLTEQEWSREATGPMSAALADKHFGAMDKDGDGELTKDEYRAARENGMARAAEAIQAWDEPQTLSEGQASGQQDQQAASSGQQGQGSGQQAKDSDSAIDTSGLNRQQEQEADDSREAAVPVFIYRFHTM